MKKTLIFDLDGTLLDSIKDIAIAMNEALKVLGYEAIETSKYNYFVGEGVDVLVVNVVKHLNKNIDKQVLLEKFVELYENKLHKNTFPYEGICELLEELNKKGYNLAVLSNKPHELTKIYVEHFFGKYNFKQVFGQREGVAKKPDANTALFIAKELGVDVKECFFIGDTKVDMLTAKNASMKSIGVLWGFRDEKELKEHGADFIVSHPKEILSIISKA